MAEKKEITGTLILQKIDFDKLFIRRVAKHSHNSCRVTLPFSLLGKEVYVIPKSEVNL